MIKVNMYLEERGQIVSYLLGNAAESCGLVIAKFYDVKTGELSERKIHKLPPEMDWSDPDPDELLSSLMGEDMSREQYYYLQDYELQFILNK